MKQFKVGDRVEFISSATASCYPPKGTRGTIVRDALDGSPKIRWDGNACQQYGNETCVHCSNWRVATDEKIIITHDGTTTLARMFEGNKVVKSAEAKCAPSDTFDFATGANLAFDRLMQRFTEAPRPEKPAAEPIKLYCIKDKDFLDEHGRALTKGKVYVMENRKIRLDDGIDYNASSWDDFKRLNSTYAACLAPLVKRKAKAGEKIYIDEPRSTGDAYEKGDICTVVVRESEHGAFVKTASGATHPCNRGKGTAYVSDNEYLVLDGYQPEPECCKCCGQPLKKESAR